MHFIRIIRTRTSEVYGILDEDDLMVGRIDLHYADDGRINGAVTVQQEMSREEELEICRKIDVELVDSAELGDDAFDLTFVQAQHVNIYGNRRD